MKLLEYLIDGVKFIVLSAIPGEKDILKWELKELDKLIKEREDESTEDSRRYEDDFTSHLMRGLRELELAKIKVSCPAVRNVIDEILLFAEERLEDLKWVSGKDLIKVAEDVLKEEGVEDWLSLDEEKKRLIKEKIKDRLR